MEERPRRPARPSRPQRRQRRRWDPQRHRVLGRHEPLQQRHRPGPAARRRGVVHLFVQSRTRSGYELRPGPGPGRRRPPRRDRGHLDQDRPERVGYRRGRLVGRHRSLPLRHRPARRHATSPAATRPAIRSVPTTAPGTGRHGLGRHGMVVGRATAGTTRNGQASRACRQAACPNTDNRHRRHAAKQAKPNVAQALQPAEKVQKILLRAVPLYFGPLGSSKNGAKSGRQAGLRCGRHSPCRVFQ